MNLFDLIDDSFDKKPLRNVFNNIDSKDVEYFKKCGLNIRKIQEMRFKKLPYVLMERITELDNNTQYNNFKKKGIDNIMKIKILDNVLRHQNLTVNKEYTVINTIVDKDDVFYVVKNDKGEKVNVIEGLVQEMRFKKRGNDKMDLLFCEEIKKKYNSNYKGRYGRPIIKGGCDGCKYDTICKYKEDRNNMANAIAEVIKKIGHETPVSVEVTCREYVNKIYE